MTNIKSIFCMAALLICFAACEKNEPEPLASGDALTLKVGIPGTGVKTALGPSVNGSRKVYWSNGDQLALNGVSSDALSGLGASESSASFTFHGTFTAPYKLLYPASFYKNETTITLPATQVWAEGGFATAVAPMACSLASAEGSANINHLCNIVYLRVRKNAGVSASNLISVKFRGNASEQVCGDFTIDYSVPSLTAAGSGQEVELSLNQSLSESEDLDLFLVVPARSYESGFSIILEDAAHRLMTKTKVSSVTLEAGKVSKMVAFEFVPSSTATELTIEDIEEEIMNLEAYNVTGKVVDSSTGAGLEGVVVSDGLQCVRTMFDGSFYMQSSVPGTKFVYVSSPSGYMPSVSGGIPRFYKLLSDVTPSGGIYDFGNFEMTPVANPDRYTLLITADPQPRSYSYTYDRIAYRSLQICQDLYQELYDVSQSISGRQVYGICLGDLVHEDMSLLGTYADALNTLAYPTYNVIGNHDNDPDAADDDAGAEPFESYFGPRNYSFNIGGIHFVVLDNLIMKLNANGKLTDYDQGLTDDIWAWLKADLAFVPKSSKLMVFGHSPMFKQESGSERTNTAAHGSDYGGLINSYSEVHAWAGHTHAGFNYIYPSSHRHRRVQVHTLARSTGELWTNEYLAEGTPRGFTIVEVDNGEISWRFHPTTRQRPVFVGQTTGYCSAGAPAYTWRDWNYDTDGVAVMKDGGGALDENYQMHVYPRGSYGDDYVYANIFLWDENWGTPTFTPAGGTPVEMTRINTADNHSIISDTEKIYDLANTEFKTHYKTYANKSGGSLHDDTNYEASTVGNITTLFRVEASASPNSGTVSVTDRFGNVYSQVVSW